MADYYPVIVRAINELDLEATGESRRALYERARAALLAELRSVQPSLPESDIQNERLALERAIRWIEQETINRYQQRQRLQSAARIDSETLAELVRIIAETDPFGSADRSYSPPPPCERYQAVLEPDDDLPAGPPPWLQHARTRMENHLSEQAQKSNEADPTPGLEDREHSIHAPVPKPPVQDTQSG